VVDCRLDQESPFDFLCPLEFRPHFFNAGHSSRGDNFCVLSVPRDLAAEPVSVLVKNLKDLIEPWCQCSILRSIRSIASWIESAPKYVIEITLPRIEYVKSAALVVEFDESKVICLLSFTCGILGNCQDAPP
jgi:hypothetical protein